MRYLLSGASGFVGQALQAALKEKGHEAIPLVRKRGVPGVFWDPLSGELNRSQLEGFDVVVNLAGENVAAGRWTADQKERILQSRVKGTALLARSISGLSHPPKVLVSASASGYYGPAVWEPVDESGAVGKGFLAEVCRGWELALKSAPMPGTRVVIPRLGLVLGNGGILAKLLPPFRFGLGGRIGSGRQWMSWISLRDAVSTILFAVEHEGLSGAFNAVSPAPLTNAEFTLALGKVLRRPTFCPVPAMALRLMFGEMAEETALSSQRLIPKKLIDSGYGFEDTEIISCLESILRR